MSESWTPGPWEVGEVSRDDGYSYREISSPIHAFWLARVLAFDVGEDPHHRADAKLIASAPDLFAALKEIQWGNAVHDPLSGENGCEYNLCPMCDQSEVRGHAPDCRVGTALAKARGEAA